MSIKSDNTKGNPYHNEDDGKFTSPDDSKTSDKSELKVSADAVQTLSKAVIVPKIKVNSANLEAIKNKINDINQCANIPKLTSAIDIENHIEEYFSKQVCGKLVELYGNSPNCSSYQFRPASNQNKVLELFPNVLAKYRFKDNHAKYISNEEYRKLSNTNGFLKNYRGMSSYGTKAQAIKDGYCDSDLNRFDLLCPNEGNCWGSNIYTSYSYNTARGYAGGYGTVIYGVLDERNAHTMTPNQLRNIMSSLNASSIEQRVNNHLLKNGIDNTKSARIAKSFVTALKKDIGLVAIMLGVDFFEARDGQSQRNILNASRWYINKDM